MSQKKRGHEPERITKEDMSGKCPSVLDRLEVVGQKSPDNFRRHHSALSLLIGCPACKTQKY
jgi:hypothetical protein